MCTIDSNNELDTSSLSLKSAVAEYLRILSQHPDVNAGNGKARTLKQMLRTDPVISPTRVPRQNRFKNIQIEVSNEHIVFRFVARLKGVSLRQALRISPPHGFSADYTHTRVSRLALNSR